MKKFIATIVCFCASLMADEYTPVIVQTLPQVKQVLDPPSELKEGLLYVRFLAADPSVLTQYQVHPGIGVGYRRIQGSSAFDILTTYGTETGHGLGAYTWAVPKVSYLHI